MPTRADVVICGAGIAGIATAYYLTVHHGIRDVVLIENERPMTLTSAKPIEGYRNWWPGPGDAMVRFMNRSIDLLEGLATDTNNLIGLSRRGYLFATTDASRRSEFQQVAAEFSALGVGDVREHLGNGTTTPYTYTPDAPISQQPGGVDVIANRALIEQHFGYLPAATRVLLHARRCGWFGANRTGMYLLEQAQQHGATLLRGTVAGVQVEQGRVAGVHLVQDETPHTIKTATFVNAAGPYVQDVGRMLGVELPVYTEPHFKIAFRDPAGIIPRHAPLIIWMDTIRLHWTDAERAQLAAAHDTRWLLDDLPAEMHWRPGNEPQSVIVAWTYRTAPMRATFPLTIEPRYPELVMRAMTSVFPDLAQYIATTPALEYDGGYYTRTQENRPLVGPLPIDGAYVIGALSGFGLMGCVGLGELITAHITGGALPPYAAAFDLRRYAAPDYQRLLTNWHATWQL
ncbi:MAG: FAD-binding oxidoreductase [Chloroflexaceae bacterium]|nr:FAD-binding oxidoreductase [Chloroflexaceae bacterium]